MKIFQFANQDYLTLLVSVPLLILLFIVARYFTKKAINRFGDYDVVRQLMPDLSKSRPIIKFSLMLLASVFLIIAIARPQFGSKLKEVKRKGIEIMLALDVSNSMLAQDIQPNRLENAKLAISKMLEKLKNDRIGLIVFAGDAYIQIPITTDYGASEMFLETINTGIVPRQGTAVGAAIRLAMKSFSPNESLSKAIIVITDGEDHEDGAVEAAQEAADKGIYVHSIGMGSAKGAPIPIEGTNNYRKDKNGNIILTKLDAATLQQVASVGKGIFVQAANTTKALQTIYDEINKLEKSEIESKVFSEYDEKFQWFAGLALFMLLAEFLILNSKNKLFRNLQLFKK